MQFHLTNLYLSPSPLFFTVGLIAIFATALLSFLAWRRATRPWRTGLLELLRLICVTFIVLLLWKPEWRTTIHPEQEPVVAILWDASKSSDTEDARLPKFMSLKQEVVKRSEFIQNILSLPDWETLSNQGETKVLRQSFSAVPEDATDQEVALATTDMNKALSETLRDYDNLRAVIMLSDGDWNAGEPPVSSAQKMRIRSIPVFPIPIGSESRLPDLDLLNVTAPTYGIIGETIQIPFAIRSSLDRDITTTVRLRNKKTNLEKTKEITIPANKEHYDSILWNIEDASTSTLELIVPLATGELIKSNNSNTFNVAGREESIRVLVIESTPRWEYRFIRNALSRDPGVHVDCLLFHQSIGPGNGPDYIQSFPENLDSLQKYDVVFLGDVGVKDGQLTPKQATLLKGLVENQASGIVFIPGSQGHQESLLSSDLGELIPVITDTNIPEGHYETTPSPLILTTEGRGSLLTMLAENEEQNPQIWKDLPGFYWFAPVIKEKGGASVLAVHGNRRNQYGRVPLLVTKTAGSGKVLYLGHDSAWRWRRGVEDLYHYRFWRQVARWMSYQRNIAAGERVRLFYTPERPKPGDSISINANAFDQFGAPLQKGTVSVQITPPGARTSSTTAKTIELEKTEETWGAYTGSFKVHQPGQWKISAKTSESDTQILETSIIVQGRELEIPGQPARPDVLEEIARVTRGELINSSEISSLVEKITALPKREPLETRVQIWAQLPTIITGIVLLSLFWIGRKLNGTF